MDRCSLLKTNLSCCIIFSSWVTRTISNLDLDMSVALGHVLYASNDFGHGRAVGMSVAWGLEGCSNGTEAVGSREILAAGYLM